MTMITIEEEETMASPTQDLPQPRFRSLGSGRSPNSRDTQPYTADIEQNALLGQFSFAPATQTTVITTTTTTTTKFPPFLMRPPRRMHELDLKHYPLAASPTPANLRNIHFEIGGKATVFREAEDTTLALEQVCTAALYMPTNADMLSSWKPRDSLFGMQMERYKQSKVFCHGQRPRMSPYPTHHPCKGDPIEDLHLLNL